MPVTYSLTAADLHLAKQLHQRETGAWRVAAAVLLLANIGLYFFGLLGGPAAIWVNPLCILSIISVPIATPLWLLLRRRNRPHSQAQTALDRPPDMPTHTYTLTPEGLRYTSARKETLCPWSFFHYWKEDAAMFLLYLNDLQYLPVPKRLVTDPAALTDLRGYLAALPHPPANDQLRQQVLYGGLNGSLLFLVFIQIALLPR